MSPRGPNKPQLERIEAAARGMADSIDHALDQAMEGDGQRVGFALFLFTFGEGGWMTYVANAKREDMIASVLEFVGRQEVQPEVQAIEERIVELAGALGPTKRHDLRRELARLKGAIRADL